MISLRGLFSTVAFIAYFSCLLFREYFGNQAGLTNCSGILIWLTGSTHRASAAPPVDKQGFISASQLPYYSHELSPLSFNFRDISLKSQESFIYFFCPVSFNIQWILFALTFLIELSFLFVDYSFTYSFISLFLCFIFSSCLAVLILVIYFVFFVLVKLC